jgi:hypothetical protein
VNEPSTDDETSSESGSPITGICGLVQFHIEIAQIDISDYMEGMKDRFNKFIDKRMKRLREEIWHELNLESNSEI